MPKAPDPGPDNYTCACGFQGTMDDVMKHVSHKINIDKDTRYYADGGHAVMLRARREQKDVKTNEV